MSNPLGTYPQVPNTMSPLVEANSGNIMMAWYRFLQNLSRHAVLPKTIMIFEGTAPPSDAWVQVTFPGFPSLPEGFIYIQKL